MKTWNGKFSSVLSGRLPLKVVWRCLSRINKQLGIWSYCWLTFHEELQLLTFCRGLIKPTAGIQVVSFLFGSLTADFLLFPLWVMYRMSDKGWEPCDDCFPAMTDMAWLGSRAPYHTCWGPAARSQVCDRDKPFFLCYDKTTRQRRIII